MAFNSKYTDEDRAGVLALQLEGLGPSEISRRSGVPLRTVDRWVASWRDMAEGTRDSRLLEQATELAIRGQLLQHAVLDAYEDMPPGELVKHAANLNNLTGTNVDKVLAITGKAGSNVQVGPFILAIMPNEEATQDITTTFQEVTE